MTYKQEESPPLYHARTAALELARRTGAAVVLGSATPSVETYYHATRHRVRLLSLPSRVSAVHGSGNTAPRVPCRWPTCSSATCGRNCGTASQHFQPRPG